MNLHKYRNKAVNPFVIDAKTEDARHKSMLNAIREYAAPPQKNLEKIQLIDSNKITKNTSCLLILMPEWANMFPPFNIARLSAVGEMAGYRTKCLDLNIKSYNYLCDKYKIDQVYGNSQPAECAKHLDYDPWEGTKEWKWTGQNYYDSELEGLLTPFFDSYIDQIVEYNPTVIGFSLYYCNYEPSICFARKLKQALPHVKILCGGPEMHKDVRLDPENVPWDYVVRGEGEIIFLDILDEIENGITHKELQTRSQTLNQRIDISQFPLPRYDDFDMEDYLFPNGVNSELSRGCTAKCAFCEETHFWKYRQREAVDAVSEIKKLYDDNGTNVIWFIDSLVNGNLQELQAFCKGVQAAGLDLHWTGYCRCNGKMDLEYYKDLKASGCEALNYGVESGSQPVLDAIQKGVTIQEMEENFKNGKQVGIDAYTNWIMGFPTEEQQDAYNTITFLHRIRNSNIGNVSPGFGFGLGMNTVVGQNPGRFGVLDHQYCGGILTHDFKLSKFHILVRMKSFYIFAKSLLLDPDQSIDVPYRPNIENHHVGILFDDMTVNNEVEYEEFDFDIIKPNINPFADSLVNEVWPLLRLLWRTRGGFELMLRFGEDIDMAEYGARNAGPFWANIIFKINAEGDWAADFEFKYKQPEKQVEQMPRVPFFAQDYSNETVNPSIRARKLAKPEEWPFDGRTEKQFAELVEEEKLLNDLIDFSFEYNYTGTGSWKNTGKIIPVEEIKSEKFVKSKRKRSSLLPKREHHFKVDL